MTLGESKGFRFALFLSRPGRWHRRLVWFVYILRCSDDSLYIGETDDVPGRMARHNDGRGSSFTASRLPVRLVLTEAYTFVLRTVRASAERTQNRSIRIAFSKARQPQARFPH
jgi:putative endonuclease